MPGNESLSQCSGINSNSDSDFRLLCNAGCTAHCLAGLPAHAVVALQTQRVPLICKGFWRFICKNIDRLIVNFAFRIWYGNLLDTVARAYIVVYSFSKLQCIAQSTALDCAAGFCHLAACLSCCFVSQLLLQRSSLSHAQHPASILPLSLSLSLTLPLSLSILSSGVARRFASSLWLVFGLGTWLSH